MQIAKKMNRKNINQRESLASDPGTFYLDFDSTLSFLEFHALIKAKARKLFNLNFTETQIVRILVYGDGLKEKILNSRYYIIAKHLIESEVSKLAKSEIESDYCP